MTSRQRFVCCLMMLTGICGCRASGAKPPSPEEDRLPRVETVVPQHGLLPVHIELSAVVEPMEKADLCARVAGVIETLHLDQGKPEVDIGRRISAGEALIKLSVPDLEADFRYKEALLEQAHKQRDQTVESRTVAEKELQEAREQEKRYEAEFIRSQEKHNRTVNLVQGGSLNRELAEETKNQLEAARSAWQAARAQIDTKQARFTATAADLKLAETRIRVAQAEKDRLQVMLDYSIIRAPFDGIVTNRWVDRGAMVKDPGTPLLRVMRTDMVRVLVDIPQRDIPLVNTTEQNPNPDGQGDVVILRIPELRDVVHGGEFPGHLTRMSSVLDPVTRTMRAEVHLENKAGQLQQPLRPGMYGTATVLLEEGKNVLTVPSTALERRGSTARLYYVADVSGKPARGVVRQAQVELGLDDGKRVEIRNGLRGNEVIIAKGKGVLRDGDAVIVVPIREP
jgi:RND family efflux transporter MFP subunit